MKKKIVVKSYGLVNSRYKLTVAEANFVYILMEKIHRKDEEFKLYEISKQELEIILNSEQKSIRLDLLTDNLMKKILKIETERGWKKFTWFQSMEYINEMGMIEVKISEDLKPHLLNLKNRFVQCELENLLSFKSIYSKRLYELLVEYQKIGNRTIKVKDMQDMFQVPKSLLVYADFKRFVLEVALKEINEKTDLNFSYTPIKLGRKVDRIQFDIKFKKVASND